MNKIPFLLCIIPCIIVLLLIRVRYSEAFIYIGGSATRNNQKPATGVVGSISVFKSFHENSVINNDKRNNDHDPTKNIRRFDDSDDDRDPMITNDSVDGGGGGSSVTVPTFSRRDAIRNGFIVSTVGLSQTLFSSERANAATGTAIETNDDGTVVDTVDTKIEYDCLQDLPPISSNSIRLYLCRHGQTENNRLRIAQGSRVDPPINNNGIKQGRNLGVALSFVPAPPPELFFSSSLRRAQMTAHLAADGATTVPPPPQGRPLQRERPRSPRQLSVLAEVDFGSFVDGQSLALVKPQMAATYARWALGDIDYRPNGGDGDSGREVLMRCCEALQTVVNEATTAEVSSVVAVSHSTFIHTMVAMLLDEPLVQSYNRKIVNGSVTVIDIPKDIVHNSRILGVKPKLLGGPISQLPQDFTTFSIPICNVIRINESRHLPPIIV